MADKYYSDLGYGEFAKIDSAIASGSLKAKDIVITKDTSEFVYIKDDNTKQIIRSRVQTFETESAAVTYLNEASDTYPGQPVAIKDADGKYQLYAVQNDSTGFIVEAVGSITTSQTGLTWKEF